MTSSAPAHIGSLVPGTSDTPANAAVRRRTTLTARLSLPVILTYALLLLLTGAAVVFGLQLRAWTWQATEPIRFNWDINNAWRWGTTANEVGVLKLYDQLVTEHGVDGRLQLDYTPMRLLIVSHWVASTRVAFPDATQWRNEYAMTWPMLRVNLAAELTAMLLMFALVRLWVKRTGGPPPRWRPLVWWHGQVRAAGLGFLAAMLLWFNLAVIWNAHAWPQWDTWLLPFFLAAMLATSVRQWLLAGAAIGIGCMFKGQILLVAPILLAWPLLRLQFGAAAKLILGFAVGVTLCTFPWLVRNGAAYALVGTVALLATGGLALAWRHHRLRPHLPWLAPLGLTCVVAAAWLAVPLCDGSIAWYHVGFGYPQRNHRNLVMGPASNLAALLAIRYRWNIGDSFHLPLWGMMPLRTFMIGLYVIALALCSIAAARRSARNDRWILLALTAPWLLMFALMPQMHDRYLLWAAGLSACWVALGVGPLLLHLLITALTWMMMAMPMFNHARDFAPAWRTFVHRSHPDAAWAVLLLAAIALYLTLKPAPTPPPANETSPSVPGAGTEHIHSAS